MKAKKNKKEKTGKVIETLDFEKTIEAIYQIFAIADALKAQAEIAESECPRLSETAMTLLTLIEQKLSIVQINVSNAEKKTFQAAEMISFLITDDSVPAKISDALGDAIADLSNPLSDDSPEAIAKVLEYHKDNE